MWAQRVSRGSSLACVLPLVCSLLVRCAVRAPCACVYRERSVATAAGVGRVSQTLARERVGVRAVSGL